jgi:hypothetical protein
VVVGERDKPATNVYFPTFRDAISGDTPLRRVTQRYLMAYLALVSQSVACNRLHNVEERFARWTSNPSAYADPETCLRTT